MYRCVINVKLLTTNLAISLPEINDFNYETLYNLFNALLLYYVYYRQHSPTQRVIQNEMCTLHVHIKINFELNNPLDVENQLFL